MIYLLIPVYNEEQNIPPLVSALDRAIKDMGENYRLIFVNDGSVDGTPGVIQKLKDDFPIEMLENSPNQGVGVSFDKGFKHFIQTAGPGDILITLEGDNTADLGTLPKLAAAIRNGNDFALASVYSKEGEVVGTTPLRLFLSFTANVLCKLIFRMPKVNTFSSFYRSYSYEAMRKLYEKFDNRPIAERGYICMVELLIKLYRSGYKFAEIPTCLNSQKRLGMSKMKIMQTIQAYFRLFAKHLL
ncbi:MAG: glycosyltransferase [Nitrospinae bacterium]|nr:glycosyltransferase [Nitrospinota bacterium]